jgi:hypothetical protein
MAKFYDETIIKCYISGLKRYDISVSKSQVSKGKSCCRICGKGSKIKLKIGPVF